MENQSTITDVLLGIFAAVLAKLFHTIPVKVYFMDVEIIVKEQKKKLLNI